MREFKIFAAIGDIHIGMKNISAEDMKKQLKNQFIKPIEKLPYLDGIFIVGDLFHTIISMNSPYSQLAHWFINKVYKIAKKKKSTVIIVKGTISHDNDQLNNLIQYQYNDDGVDFRIYDTVTQITIWEDYNVLILPDIRVKNKKDILDYLDNENEYDLILGHGLIDKMEFFVQESEESHMKTVVYKSDKLMNSCKGPVIFGHIHQFQHINNKFFYTGSFTLLERGITNPGFLICGIYDPDRTKFCVERYSNTDAPVYHNWEIDEEMLAEIDITELMSALDTMVSELNDNDIVTLRIKRGDSISDSDKVLMLDTRYRSDKRIKITKSISTKGLREQEAKAVEDIEKYSYLFDENLPMGEMMWRYFDEDIKPTITDPSSKIASITKEDFDKMLEDIL